MSVPLVASPVDTMRDGNSYILHTYFLTIQGHGGPHRMTDQHNAGATSE